MGKGNEPEGQKPSDWMIGLHLHNTPDLALLLCCFLFVFLLALSNGKSYTNKLRETYRLFAR